MPQGINSCFSPHFSPTAGPTPQSVPSYVGSAVESAVALVCSVLALHCSNVCCKTCVFSLVSSAPSLWGLWRLAAGRVLCRRCVCWCRHTCRAAPRGTASGPRPLWPGSLPSARTGPSCWPGPWRPKRPFRAVVEDVTDRFTGSSVQPAPWAGFERFVSVLPAWKRRPPVLAPQ